MAGQLSEACPGCQLQIEDFPDKPELSNSSEIISGNYSHVEARLKIARRQRLNKVNLMRNYLSGRAGCLYKQTAGSWNVLDTFSDVIICNHLLATRRFRHVPEPSTGFHEVLWDSMRPYDVPVNQSVPTEANRGLTSYTL
jgi:hypothetical protein